MSAIQVNIINVMLATIISFHSIQSVVHMYIGPLTRMQLVLHLQKLCAVAEHVAPDGLRASPHCQVLQALLLGITQEISEQT